MKYVLRLASLSHMDDPEKNEPDSERADLTPDAIDKSLEMDYVEWERFSLKDERQLDERWLEEYLIEHPDKLGLGDELQLIENQRHQRTRGRLDLLFSDRSSDAETRYAVEVQLGAADSDHLFRAIEYWNIEKKGDPFQRQHVCVLVVEEIDDRKLGVMRALNEMMPLVVVRAIAARRGRQFTVHFVPVLDWQPPVQEPSDPGVSRDLDDWKRRNPISYDLMEKVLGRIQSFDPDVSLNSTDNYIGLYRRGKPRNYVRFFFSTGELKLRIRLADEDAENVEEALESVDLRLGNRTAADHANNTYVVIVTAEVLDDAGRLGVLLDFIRKAFEEYGGGH